MFKIEVMRGGSLSVADHIANLKNSLSRKGFHPISLDADRILQGRIIFLAQFSTQAEADRARLLLGIGGEVSLQPQPTATSDYFSRFVAPRPGERLEAAQLSPLWQGRVLER